MKVTKYTKLLIESGKAEVLDVVNDPEDVTMAHLVMVSSVLKQLTLKQMRKLVFDELGIDAEYRV